MRTPLMVPSGVVTRLLTPRVMVAEIAFGSTRWEDRIGSNTFSVLGWPEAATSLAINSKDS